MLDVAQVAEVKAAGGTLVVSPDMNPAVIAATRAADMASYPGVMTPTEAFGALRAGATGLKLFPGTLVGPAGLKAIRAVLPPGTECWAVGGAGPENFAAWFAAGATGFGIGTALYTPGVTADDVRDAGRGGGRGLRRGVWLILPRTDLDSARSKPRFEQRQRTDIGEGTGGSGGGGVFVMPHTCLANTVGPGNAYQGERYGFFENNTCCDSVDDGVCNAGLRTDRN